MKPTHKNNTPKTRNKPGPPVGNTNAARHYLVAGKLPKKLAYIENRVNAMRRGLESEVLKAHGEISLTLAAAISSALKWERHGLLATAWLRKSCDEMTPETRLKYSEAIAKASDNRDKHLRLLGLDVDQSPWAGAFDGTVGAKP